MCRRVVLLSRRFKLMRLRGGKEKVFGRWFAMLLLLLLVACCRERPATVAEISMLAWLG